MNELIQMLPKAELHMHIEGSLEPELMFKLAARNGIDLPYDSVAELQAKYDFNSVSASPGLPDSKTVTAVSKSRG